MSNTNPFDAKKTLKLKNGSVNYFQLGKLEESGLAKLPALPYSIRILLESALRNCDGFQITEADVKKLAKWSDPGKVEIPFKPGRVVLQDFTGVPCVVDLAAMRAAMKKLGGDPAKINPLVPCDLVIDHSVQVDAFGNASSLEENQKLEFERNRERYEFLRWGKNAFRNFRVVPPGTGIVHQVNLEYLAKGVMTDGSGANRIAFPDSVVGTDSHTTMINGLGVLGWGVGGIEAEAVMLGQPIYMVMPEVVGFELTGNLAQGATATDMVLTITQMLRKHGVVDKFVEFFGNGLKNLSLANRATIANMAPEYGATMGFFPVDDQTLTYLRLTGRREDEVDLVERYCKEQGLFWNDKAPVPTFSSTLKLDLSTVEPCLAGPKRPQDRVNLKDMKTVFNKALKAPVEERGFGLDDAALARKGHYKNNGGSAELSHGAVTIAAITSCTNTSNPSVMLAAGLLAKKAAERGLKAKAWVKTSLAPGSRVVSDYLDKAGLTKSLNEVGFYTVGYGCTTCIGNSGPLPDAVIKAVQEGNLVVSAVLSGNRNFEGRVNPHVKANYLASPPLVVAYALAGTVDIDLATQPIGKGKDGKEVFLKNIWPTEKEVQDLVTSTVQPEQFRSRYMDVADSNPEWNAIPVVESQLYEWKEKSTYIQEPPFFQSLSVKINPISGIRGARVLAVLGDSVTTDHISPAGSIAAETPAGKFLVDHGVGKKDFNSYGARRGNDRVMTRGTFANIRLRNHLAPGTEGGWTTYLPAKEVMYIYDASVKYKALGTPLVVLAGKEYGTGSSRDWAAKGVMLLGVKAVIAESFERIHRSNLVGMGVLPLVYPAGQTAKSLGLSGWENFDIAIDDSVKPGQNIRVTAKTQDGKEIVFDAKCRLDTPVDVEYYRNGGILQTVLRNFLK